ncbi:MAG TPA: FAD-binding protein [Ramlibacter sp.]|jgi:succinate dehydrogenase/fumarate reductase flavoprotein subunit|nr:FAD-binding protein [Ramlibacter sp.]
MRIPVETLSTDVLVLGGGLAGYRAAVAAREQGAQVTMAFHAHGASPYVIGFNAPIASEDPRDAPEVLFDDMVRGGYGINDRRLVRILAQQSVDAYRELAALGVPFAMRDGRTAQRHLSGNTYARSVYVPEGTGGALLQALKARTRELGVQTLSPCKLVDLLGDGERVFGALLWKPRSASFVSVQARAAILATGGIGRLYPGSTYPADVAADALGIALQAGARLVDMEFVQFEPVVTVWPPACRGMEMPTAMLGDGAQLRNAQGERFMLRVNPPLGERGIEKAKMALHIQREIDEGRGLPEGGVIFDTTLLAPERLESYVSHCSRLRRAGVDPARQPPIVAPAAHSVMGGIAIDERGATGVPGLFAGGESAGGVHGASRVAGNGCADTLVFGALAGRSAAQSLGPARIRDWPAVQAQALDRLAEACRGRASGAQEAKQEIAAIVANCAGIWRSGAPLRAGSEALADLAARLADARAADIADAIALQEARRMAAVARTIVRGALARTESRGAHQRTDHPETDDARWMCHVTFRRDAAGEIVAEETPVDGGLQLAKAAQHRGR